MFHAYGYEISITSGETISWTFESSYGQDGDEETRETMLKLTFSVKARCKDIEYFISGCKFTDKRGYLRVIIDGEEKKIDANNKFTIYNPTI